LIGQPILLPQDVHEVVFSSRAERIVTVGNGPMAQVWQVETGQLQVVLPRLDSPLTHYRYSADERLILLGDGKGGARVWDLATGRSRTPPLCHGSHLAAAAFHQDGRQLVTLNTQGAAYFWQLPGYSEDDDGRSRDLSPEERPVDDLVALAQVLAGARIDEMQRRRLLPANAIYSAWTRFVHAK
jgi:WD40 repeat protein